jgi:glutamate dehydrogenase/leucine dehydrogenase
MDRIVTLLALLPCSSLIFQGFGKLGSWAAQSLVEAGGKVLAVSSSEAAYYKDGAGLDITALRKHVGANPKGGLANFTGGTGESN